jgi:hypothetical protein
MRLALLGIAASAVAAIGACTEKLDGGANCITAPQLCPGQSVGLRDTIIDPVLLFDSTYSGFPTIGSEFYIPLISYGDSLETVAVVRYDTLAVNFTPPKDTFQAIRYVDSSRVMIMVELTRSNIPDSVRFDLFDVNADTSFADTATGPVLKQFTPQRLIGGGVIAKGKLVDSVFIPVKDSVIIAHLQDSSAAARGFPSLRIGVRVRGFGGPVSFRMGTVESGNPMQLRYRPFNDTSVHALVMTPASAGPAARSDVQRDLMDYSVVSKSLLPRIPGTMTLGGVPGNRTYMRFTIPSHIIDSSTIVRATLRLQQVPYPFGGALDTVTVNGHVVLAGPNITDYRRASSFITAAGVVVTDSLSVLPAGSGLQQLEMYALVRAWAAQAASVTSTSPAPPPQAIVLAVSNEGTLPRVAAFKNSSAPAGQRPSMRITYIPKTQFGVP